MQLDYQIGAFNSWGCFNHNTNMTPTNSSVSQIARSWGQHGANLGPVGPKWVPCCPHKPCCHGSYYIRARWVQNGRVKSTPVTVCGCLQIPRVTEISRRRSSLAACVRDRSSSWGTNQWLSAKTSVTDIIWTWPHAGQFPTADDNLITQIQQNLHIISGNVWIIAVTCVTYQILIRYLHVIINFSLPEQNSRLFAADIFKFKLI